MKSSGINSELQPQDEITKELSVSLDKALKDAEPNWWGNLLEAQKYEKTEPDRAESIYGNAAKKFPNNGTILHSYAISLRMSGKTTTEQKNITRNHWKQTLMMQTYKATMHSSFVISGKTMKS